jgi:malonyl-CoA O-methyltransferase
MRDKKYLIKESFSSAAGTYDTASMLQREVAEELGLMLIGHLKKTPACVASRAGIALSSGKGHGRNVLDIGCGTGAFLGLFRDMENDFIFHGMDISLPMLKKSGADCRIRLINGDLEALPFQASAFDVIASSLAFQWAGDLSTAFSEAKRVLRPGGVFAFATLGPETLKELRHSLGRGISASPASLFSLDEIEDSLRRTGFLPMDAGEKTVTKTYKDIYSLLRTLKETGASPPFVRLCNGLGARQALRHAEQSYKHDYGGEDGIPATYEVIFALATHA